MGIQISLWDSDFISFDYISRSGIMDHITVLFQISSGTATVFFHGSCTSIHPYQQCISPLCLHILNNICHFLHFLVLTFQTGMRRYPLCFWSAFPFIISDAEHLVIYLLIICMSYLWENVYSFKMEHTLCLLYSNIWNSVAYLYINNKLSESGIKKTIPFTIASKKR